MRRRGAVPLSFQRLAHPLGRTRASTSDVARTPPAARFDEHNTDATNNVTSDSSSNNAANPANIACTINADIATNSSNANSDNTASFVDTTCTFDPNAADSRTPF